MGELKRCLLNFLAFSGFSATTTRLMVLAAAFVAPQPFFDADRRLMGAFIGIGGHAFGLEKCPGIKMQYAFRTEPEAVLADRGVAGIPATDIFRGRLFHPLGDFSLKCRADIYVSPRNA